MNKFKITAFLVVLLINPIFSQDWANLKRFQKDNIELMSSKSKDPRIVLMGNSITEGWLNARPEFFEGKN